MMPRARIAAVVLALATLFGCESDETRARQALDDGLSSIEAHPAEAAARLEEAVELDPSLREAHAALARARLAQERYSDAAAAIERSLALGAPTADEYEVLAHARVGLEEWEPAATAIEQALALDPARTGLLLELGRAYEHLDRAGDAEGAYERAVAADDALGQARIALARVLLDRAAREPEPTSTCLPPPSADGTRAPSPRERARTLLTGTTLAEGAPEGAELRALRARSTGLDARREEACRASIAAAVVERATEAAVPSDGLGLPARDVVDADDALGHLGHGAGDGSSHAPFGPEPAAGPRARVALGATQVTGELAPEIVVRIVRRHMAELHRCYELELASAPTLAGTAHATFDIAADGSVASASATGLAGVDACVATRIRAWSFPASSGVVHVALPMSFTFE